jgi:hypothetical protein
MISKSSVDRRCYTSESWVSKEKSLTRMKVRDPLSTVKVERTHQVLIPHTSKSIALIQTDVGHRKIGRKILDFHS